MKTLKQAKVKNFQSIADVTVDFGSFTVMVGPSNSGKSAFLRGVRTCVRNSFVPSNVRQGTSKSEVDLEFNDGVQVGIERGKSLSTYKMGSGSSVFTKSSRTVPDEVMAALRFPLLDSIDPSFSFQFDKPFLLSESGSTAAQVIGSLTNVSMLHQAVREANRRRQEASGVLKVREKDVERYTAQLETFRDLPGTKKKLQNAEEKFNSVRSQQRLLDNLTSAVSVVEFSMSELDSIDETPPTNKTEEILHLRELNDELKALSKVANNLASTISFLKSDVAEVKKIKSDIDLTKNQYHDRLVELKQCPVCGSEIVPDWP